MATLSGTGSVAGGASGGFSSSGSGAGFADRSSFDFNLGNALDGTSEAARVLVATSSLGGVAGVERNSSKRVERNISRSGGSVTVSRVLVERGTLATDSGAPSTASRTPCLVFSFASAVTAVGMGSAGAAGSGSGNGAVMRDEHFGQSSSMPAMASGTARRALQAGQVNLMRLGFKISGCDYPKYP